MNCFLDIKEIKDYFTGKHRVTNNPQTSGNPIYYANIKLLADYSDNILFLHYNSLIALQIDNIFVVNKEFYKYSNTTTRFYNFYCEREYITNRKVLEKEDFNYIIETLNSGKDTDIIENIIKNYSTDY